MGMIKCLLSLSIFYVMCLIFADSEATNYDDSVVIEGSPSGAVKNAPSSIRKNVYLPYFQYLESILPFYGLYSPSFKQNYVRSELCKTNNQEEGRCVSFQRCYPKWSLPDAQFYEVFFTNILDRCIYTDANGQQASGVCCVNATIPRIVTPEDSVLNGDYRVPNYPSWPPPLPTHPPDHTIPPLPTHPPAHGLPTYSTAKSTRFPINGKPTATATFKPPVTAIAADSAINDISCGARSIFTEKEKIVGGEEANIGEWPWIAGLFSNGRQFCGGSLIDNTHVLTAAHCVAHMSSWDVARLTIRLGDHNIRTSSETRHLELRAKRVVRHKGFDSRTLYNDIAMITLETPVQFSKKIRPVCLPPSGSNFAGKMATVIGWGSLRENGPQPSALQKVKIPIWSNAECRAKYGPAAPGGIVDHMLCAGHVAKDSCSGDSGGPLMVNTGKWIQAGIVSWGIGCGKGNYPGVYTKVEKFLPWIYKNLKN